MWQFDTKLSQVVQRTPNIKSFRFSTEGQRVTYEPGQFFFITIKVFGEDAIHHFSLSSSPTEEGHIEFTKRITASHFSQTLDTIEPGAWAHVEGPEGAFTLSPSWRQLAFISGGIGITPLRSMLRYVADKKLSYDIVLLYGNNNVEDIAFKEELDELSSTSPGLRVVYVLSGPNFPPNWTGKKGFINRDIIAESVPDYMQRLFYISGPPKMVVALEDQLVALGIPGNQMKRDSFTGYD
jgi:ferredoxin-NADP reductase